VLAIFAAENREQVIDFIFMDGDHTRRGCFQDAQTFLPHLKIGGILVLHDIYPERCGWLGPRYLIEALQRTEISITESCFAIQEIADLDPFGIAVCRKQSEFPLRQLSPGLFARSHLAQLIERDTQDNAAATRAAGCTPSMPRPARTYGARGAIALWHFKQVEQRLTADALQPIEEVDFAAYAPKREPPRISRLCCSSFHRFFF
jgi:hypothetical protein